MERQSNINCQTCEKCNNDVYLQYRVAADKVSALAAEYKKKGLRELAEELDETSMKIHALAREKHIVGCNGHVSNGHGNNPTSEL